MKSLQNKVVLLTGGAGFLGQSFGRAIASQGGLPILADMDESKARDFAAELEQEFPGCRATAVSMDICSETSVSQTLLDIHSEFGKLDALVNNAYPRTPTYGKGPEEISYDDFNGHIQDHLGGYFLCCRESIKIFREQGGGNIVNLCSIYGFVTPRFQIYSGTDMTTPVEYAVTKAGILQLTRYFARYLKASGIRVNCLSPGGVLRGQPESFLEAYRQFCSTKGMLEPQDLSGAIIFLLSDQSMSMNGQNLVIDDGFSL